MRWKDDRKERRIKEAVIKLMLKEGFDGTSISKIARAAGVSPATIYIYYESKEEMLSAIYREYSEEIFGHLLAQITPDLRGEEVIATLMRNYYSYMTEHREVYSFIEQSSTCPAFAACYSEQKSVCRIFSLIAKLKKDGSIRNYSDEALWAVIFYPVKALAGFHYNSGRRTALLDELILMVQEALLP
jgi:AcrR family transcriptional regulator